MNFQAKAIEALQHAAEDYLVHLYEDVSLPRLLRPCLRRTAVAVAYCRMPLFSQVNLEAIHAKRVTIFPCDIQVWQLYCAETCCPRASRGLFKVARESLSHSGAACAMYPWGAVLKPLRHQIPQTASKRRRSFRAVTSSKLESKVAQNWAADCIQTMPSFLCRQLLNSSPKCSPDPRSLHFAAEVRDLDGKSREGGSALMKNSPDCIQTTLVILCRYLLQT